MYIQFERVGNFLFENSVCLQKTIRNIDSEATINEAQFFH